jgi:hypothetical protein
VVNKSEFALSIAPKRFSQAEQGTFVAERFYTTGWMEIIENGKNYQLSTINSQFIKSLPWYNMPLQTYGTLYNAWTDRFTGYECSMVSGTFTSLANPTTVQSGFKRIFLIIFFLNSLV